MSARPIDDVSRKTIQTVIKWIGNRHAWMAVSVIRHSGLMYFSDDVETAAVIVNGKRTYFVFNKKFFKSLRLIELAAILLHESFHVIFEHIKRSKSYKKKYDKRLFYYSCEAVINDIIAKYFCDMKLPCDPILGVDLVGEPVHDKTADQVYAMLVEQLLKKRKNKGELGGIPGGGLNFDDFETVDDHITWEDDFIIEDESNGELIHSDWNEDSDKVAETAQQKSRTDTYGKSPSSTVVSVAYVKPPRSVAQFLIQTIKSSRKYQTCWTEVNKKTIAVYPAVVLPTYPTKNADLTLLFALDASGSISQKQMEQFLSVARNPLPNTSVRIITFDTKAYEITNEPDKMIGRGRTDVHCIQEFIDDNYKNEKDLDEIFVLTDGYFSPVKNVKDPKKWVWLTTGDTTTMPKESRIEKF